MEPETPSSTSLRASRRSQRATNSVKNGSEAVDSNNGLEDAEQPAKIIKAQTKVKAKTNIPKKSQKHANNEADFTPEETGNPGENKGNLESVSRRKDTEEGKVVIQEEFLVAETHSQPKKREKQDEKEQGPQIDTVDLDTTRRKPVAKVEEKTSVESRPSPKKTKRKRSVSEEKPVVNGAISPSKTKQKAKTKTEEETDEDGESLKKVKRRRKTKEEKEAEAMPLATRTVGLRMFIGAHVSCAKGVHNSVTNCVHIGGNAFAMFLKSQRKWENPPLQDEHRDLFISSCGQHKYDASSHILPHGSYLVNLAQEDAEKAKQAYTSFLEDLQRCEALGIKLYNFHPGWTGSHPRPSAIARLAKALNRAHLATKTVVPVLETMAGGGNVIGSTFEDLRDIIALIDDKTRIGVCLDTCHVFAAGYDLRTPTVFKKTLKDFDSIVGMKYLRALHINDSKAPFNSHRDLHQNIGLGFLGLRAFHNIMNETRFEGMPLVLETPIDHKDEESGKDVEDKGVWAREIKMLEGLIGMDADGEEFKALEQELSDKGAEERQKLQEQFERKVDKQKKALEKGQKKLEFGGKKKKKKAESDKESDSEA